jgi:hypothetical protein
MTTLEKNYDDICTILERTDLVKMILETSKDGSMYKFEGSERHMARGYNAFVRKLANKIVSIQSKHEEANLILESIPEWSIYTHGDLAFMNDLESKPLAQDPRKKNDNGSKVEDDIEYFFKIKSFQQNKMKTATNENDNKQDDDNEEEEEGEDVDFEQSQNKVEYEPATGENDDLFKKIMDSRDDEYDHQEEVDEKYLSNDNHHNDDEDDEMTIDELAQPQAPLQDEFY